MRIVGLFGSRQATSVFYGLHAMLALVGRLPSPGVEDTSAEDQKSRAPVSGCNIGNCNPEPDPLGGMASLYTPSQNARPGLPPSGMYAPPRSMTVN